MLITFVSLRFRLLLVNFDLIYLLLYFFFVIIIIYVKVIVLYSAS